MLTARMLQQGVSCQGRFHQLQPAAVVVTALESNKAEQTRRADHEQAWIGMVGAAKRLLIRQQQLLHLRTKSINLWQFTACQLDPQL